MSGRIAALLLLVAALTLFGCSGSTSEAPAGAGESWSVTAWGESFEVFPEVDALVVGQVSSAHTHVTRLSDFAPLVEGNVEIVFKEPGGEQVFGADAPVRPGIFSIEIDPEREGEFELWFRIRDNEGDSEEIRGGKVRVGTAESPGGVVVAPAPKAGSDGGEPLPFLKEQQWKSDFATDWVRSGHLASSVLGVARLRPPAGGESMLTAPVDGVVQRPSGSGSWPFVGQKVSGGTALLEVVPRVANDKSLARLETDLRTLDNELLTARARRTRLMELLALEATSQRELEEAKLRVETLVASRAAAARDLEAARSVREGVESRGLALRAPFSGEVASVTAMPGSTVAAGDTLARLVRTDVLWVEVALAPGAARRVTAEGVSGLVLTDPELGALSLGDGNLGEGLRLVSVAPELSARTGTVTVLLEAPGSAGLAFGTTLEAQILLSEEQQGVVVPAAAVIDDGGVPVAYLQLSGESFARQQVHILARQGDRVLVEHLAPGQRLVTQGGEAIRRSSLMASGEAHGHVH